MKKNVYIIFAVLAVFIASGWFIMFQNPPAVERAGVKEENNITAEPAKKDVIITIDNGEGSPAVASFEFKDGMTAFDLLKTGAEKLVLQLKTKNYDMGVFIEAIGNKQNGQDGKYWLYYVNGEMPQVSADKQKLNSGDKVEFKFEKSSF